MKTQNITRFLLLICINFLLFSCEDPTTHTEPPYEGPPKDYIISVERALEMYEGYSQRRVPIINKYEDSITADGSKFTPTRYAEYDLATIKQYIAYIEHEAKEANVDIKTLRFYLSNYPNSDKFPNGDMVKYPRRNSFFVVPTMGHDGGNVGFYIEEMDGKYTAVPIRKRGITGKETQQNNEQQEGEMNEASFFTFSNTNAVQGGGTSLILNDSHLAPPPGSDDFGGNN
jgi:hypothetical protein